MDTNIGPAEIHPNDACSASYLANGPQSGPAVGHPEPNAGTSWAEQSHPTSPEPATSGAGPPTTELRSEFCALQGARVNLWFNFAAP